MSLISPSPIKKFLLIIFLIIISTNSQISNNKTKNNNSQNNNNLKFLSDENKNYSLPPLAFIAHKLSYHNNLISNFEAEYGYINFRTIESDDKAFRCNILTLKNPINEEKIDIIVVFRGTKVSYMKNIFADLNITPKKIEGLCNECRVHRGFYDAFKTIGDKVMSQLKEEVLSQFKKGKIIEDLYYAGHSLGGGLASVGLYDFLNEREKAKKIKGNNSNINDTDYHFDLIGNLSLYTFGCPRVGDKKFRDFFNRKDLLKNNLRVVYGQDIVPDLLVGKPLSQYRHIGDFAHFRRNEFEYPIVFERNEVDEWKREWDIFDKINIKERIADHGRYFLLNAKGIEYAIKYLEENAK